MKNFWVTLPKPLLCLAPLANVTDAAFRRVIARYSKSFNSVQDLRPAPHVMYTEFVSADGLCLAHEEGRQKLLRDLLYTEQERPIVAQFFTAVPAHMERAAALAAELGFDGVDINMGCPDKAIERQGAGAKLIQTPALAQELVQAAKRGAPGLPVSVKTRLGYNKDTLEEWLPALLAARPAAVALHARTRKEMSKVPARWERVRHAVEIRNETGSDTLLIGNGDVVDLAEARVKAAESGADGIMIGRGIFGKPWLFAPSARGYSSEPALRAARPSPTVSSEHPLTSEISFRLRILAEHTKLFEELLGDIKNFAIMKKHFKAYVEGFPGARELRMELMETQSAAQVEDSIERWLAAHESQTGACAFTGLM